LQVKKGHRRAQKRFIFLQALPSEPSDKKDKDAQEMMIASEYILHDPISSDKYKNFPSRASSGASSADPNTYRERYALSRNNDGVSSDEGTGEDMLNILDGNHKEVAFDDLNFNRCASLTEAELWQEQVKNDLGKTSLSSSEIKRQETIYEFIRTERSHLNTLLLLKRVWGNGLKQKPFRHVNVDKLLPGISAMIYQSYRFLLLLNERQNQQYPVLQSIGDVLVKYFEDDEKDMIKAFGRFCACHGDALAYFKELVENDKKFSQFIVNTRAAGSTNRLELPDCLQMAMQRITKYPLMLQKIKERTKNADLDVSKRIHELDSLNGAINKIKSIAEQVDQYVKFVSRENRLKEICKKLDTRHRSSKTVGRKTSFGKNDLTYDKRRLLYETFAVIKPGQAPKSGKKSKETIDILLLLMTDYLVMLKPSKETKISTSKEDSVLMMPLKINTNATSYSFMKLPTEQPTVIPLRGLIVRENPTSEDMRYILSAKHAEIGLYELQFKDSETALSFTEQTRLAASFCPDDLDSPTQGNDAQPVDPAILKEIDRLENLVDNMKKLDARLVDDYNNKQDFYVEFKKLKDPTAPVLKLPRFVLHDEPEKQKITPIIEEAHQYAKDCDGSDSSKEPLLHCLAKTMLLLCQHDTWYANMQLNAAKHTYLPGSFNQIKDLNQMERFHDIEAKRFDRQRKKEKDDLKKLQAQLDRERKTLEDERKLVEAEKQAIDKQKSALDVNVVNKLKNLQLKDEKYDTEMKNFDEKQRMLMKMRDMQRYIDELEARAGFDLSPGHTSHSESPCSSKPNSFNQNDLNYPISLSKRSSSGKADKFASIHKLNRHDSTSPERPPSRSVHSRSKSNASNKTSSTAVSDSSSQMLPLQLSAKHVNDDDHDKKKKGIFRAKEEKKLGPKTTSLVDKRFELQASTDKLDKIKSQSHSSEKKSGNVWLV